MKKERNMQFAILQVIAIIAVVVGHFGGANLVSEWFPIYSWHMPIFLFISGYFYSKEQENNIFKYIWKKTKKLFIPCFVWNIIYCVVAYILVAENVTAFGQKFDLERIFLWPLWNGTQWGINLPAWFGLSLFFIQIVYLLIRKVMTKIHINNEVIFFIIFLFCGFAGVKLTYLGYREKWWLTLVKIMFGLAFYAMGYLYKVLLEKYIDKINNLVYFIVIFASQFLILHVFEIPVKISMWNGVFNEIAAHCYTPFFTALPGMLFWIRVSKILEPGLRNSKIIKAISENTYDIMMHHQFVCFCFNYLLLKINLNIVTLEGFEWGKFRISPYYTAKLFGTKEFLIVYLALGISIPVIFGLTKKHLINKIKNIYQNRKRKGKEAI